MGTPGKLLRLAELGAFDVHNLRLLLADMYVDAKARHICSMQVSHVCALHVCLICVLICTSTPRLALANLLHPGAFYLR